MDVLYISQQDEEQSKDTTQYAAAQSSDSTIAKLVIPSQRDSRTTYRELTSDTGRTPVVRAIAL